MDGGVRGGTVGGGRGGGHGHILGGKACVGDRGKKPHAPHLCQYL